MLNIRAIYTSPLERAVETAEAIAQSCGLTPVVRADLGELSFGAWEGRTFQSLAEDPAWQLFNTARTLTHSPGGERMIEAQSRMVQAADEIRSAHGDETVALVSHGDPLRALIAYYLGAPLDHFDRFEVSPASVTAIRLDQSRSIVLYLNRTEHF